jgi:predicted SAM-dependent methyltransferase
MLEHLNAADVPRFLREAWRVLAPGAWLRIVVPDLHKHALDYVQSGDANEFLRAIHMAPPQTRSLLDRAKFLLVGARHHQWMYDGNSLLRLLTDYGFEDARCVPAGTTSIPDVGELDLAERSHESVYVEARRPL